MAAAEEKSQRHGQWAVYAAQAVVAVVGLRYGYAFGKEISGPVMGVVLAANTAIFGALGVNALVDLGGRLWAAPRKAARPPH